MPKASAKRPTAVRLAQVRSALEYSLQRLFVNTLRMSLGLRLQGPIREAVVGLSNDDPNLDQVAERRFDVAAHPIDDLVSRGPLLKSPLA